MRPFLTLALALLCTMVSYAQKPVKIPEWGNVNKDDLLMKECEFDKDAEAVVLFDVGELVCDISLNIQLERRVRIKILKEDGLSQANIKLLYEHYKNGEDISKLAAQTYNLDEAGNITITPIEKKSVFDTKLNARYSHRIFSFENVKPGSIIEYKYIRKGTGLVNWNFQKSIPVVFSRYSTDFPLELTITSTPFCVLPYHSTSQDKGNRNVQTYEMSEIPALRDEPYMTNEDDYVQRVQTIPISYASGTQRINFVRSWPGIIRQLMEDDDFGLQLKKNIPRTSDLDSALKTLRSPFEKMKTIHHYVRKNMMWNEQTNIWALDGVKAAWKDKKGTSGEINLILVNLLKDAGLDAYPVLVSTRDNGRVITMLADYRQFDKVLAYVKIGENVYVMDATDKHTPSHLIPAEVHFSDGLVIEKLETYQWGWQTLWNEKTLKKRLVVIRAEITDKDSIAGEANVISYDYDRLERVPTLLEGKEKLKEKFFTSQNPQMRIGDLQLENEANDSLPLVQKFDFAQPISGSGDYKFFTLNLFTGLEKNPFVAESRFSDVFFGMNQSISIIGNFRIPEGYVYEELPKNVKMIMPDTTIEVTRRIAAENTQLSVRINLEFKQPYYSTENYEYFMNFYKKLMELLNEQIVFRKKSIPQPKP
ncbi:MAG: DUF3857 domain-containing protein [Chitinophagaceae bacterium]|nr:DUF3857 domain-containing protein [Chitinophagaceae bacterium]